MCLNDISPYHASSGAKHLRFGKEVQALLQVKCPALDVSVAEPGSSSNSSSLERTSTYSFCFSLFFHTSSSMQSSGSASTSSPVGGTRMMKICCSYTSNTSIQKPLTDLCPQVFFPPFGLSPELWCRIETHFQSLTQTAADTRSLQLQMNKHQWIITPQQTSAKSFTPTYLLV